MSQASTNKPLAIVVPVWKADYLVPALDSLAAQTCGAFRVYVGDDASPDDIRGVCDRYTGRMEIVYHRFQTNLGGRDLVGQWERCIGLTTDEPWIWLFSDDDVADPACVEDLLRELPRHPGVELFHFDMREIDGSGNLRFETPSYPAVLTGTDFFRLRRDGRILSFATEFVFSREVYARHGGFVKFDLAWGTDLATWTLFAGRRGMATIGPSKVSWRRSAVNITPNGRDMALLVRKVAAEADYSGWTRRYFRDCGEGWTFRDELKMLLAQTRGSITAVPKSPLGRWIRLCRAIGKESPWPFATVVVAVLQLVGTAYRRVRKPKPFP